MTRTVSSYFYVLCCCDMIGCLDNCMLVRMYTVFLLKWLVSRVLEQLCDYLSVCFRRLQQSSCHVTYHYWKCCQEKEKLRLSGCTVGETLCHLPLSPSSFCFLSNGKPVHGEKPSENSCALSLSFLCFVCAFLSLPPPVPRLLFVQSPFLFEPPPNLTTAASL